MIPKIKKRWITLKWVSSSQKIWRLKARWTLYTFAHVWCPVQWQTLKKNQQDGKQIKSSVSDLIFFSFLRKRISEGKIQSLGYLDNEVGGRWKAENEKGWWRRCVHFVAVSTVQYHLYQKQLNCSFCSSSFCFLKKKEAIWVLLIQYVVFHTIRNVAINIMPTFKVSGYVELKKGTSDM